MSTDRRTVQLVISILGLFSLVGLLGIVWLMSTNHKADDVAPLVALVGTAIGGIGAMLVSTRSVDVVGLQQLADAQQGAEGGGGPAGPERPAEVVIRPADEAPAPIDPDGP